MELEHETLGRTIRQWRRRRGFSQEELASRAGLSRPYLTRIETARQEPSLTTLYSLARALRVPVGRLLT